jgi:hypothetical protein
VSCEYSDSHLDFCPQQVYDRKSNLCYYHAKVVDGLVSKTSEYLSSTEVDALFGGRRRNDGRRLDHYTRK